MIFIFINSTNIGVSYFENNLNSFCKDDIGVIGIGNYLAQMMLENSFVTKTMNWKWFLE